MNFLVLFLFIILSINANAELSLSEVVKSTKAHYPNVLNALDEVKAAQAKVQVSEGAFDLNLKAKTDNRLEGYYGGDYFDVILEKPLQFLNSKIYGGYRKSENEFPDYEGKLNTLDGGEARLGVQLSLWRDRAIDEKRLDLFNNKLGVEVRDQAYLEQENEVLKNATKAYWNWVAKGFLHNISLELLEVMQNQGKAIRSKIKSGDLAKIYATENSQYIMKRKTEVLLAYQDFQEAALLLSLFLRGSEGSPLLATKNDLPKNMDIITEIKLGEYSKILKKAIKINPKLKSLSLQDLQLDNEEMAAQNFLSPKVDLKFEVSKDQGQGPVSLEGEEQRVMLQIEIPIERNLGLGQKRNIAAKQRIIDRDSKFQLENIQVKLKTIYTSVDTHKEVIENTKKELEYARVLQKAERQRFIQGASDFFVVNLRDLAVAEAQVKLVKSKLILGKTIAEYRALTMSF